MNSIFFNRQGRKIPLLPDGTCKSKTVCMPYSKVVQCFSEVVLLPHPPKHNRIIQYVNRCNIYGREDTFPFILGWNIILLDQTKVKRNLEGQDGPILLT